MRRCSKDNWPPPLTVRSPLRWKSERESFVDVSNILISTYSPAQNVLFNFNGNMSTDRIKYTWGTYWCLAYLNNTQSHRSETPLSLTCLCPDKTYPCSAELHLEKIWDQTRSCNRRSADNIMLGITTGRRLVVYLRWFLWSSGTLIVN
jgi:hypothetical protein